MPAHRPFRIARFLRAWAAAAALTLVHALAGCCHPKAARLLARLGEHPDADARVALRADVLQLLTLTFGRAEALRRLQ